MWPFKQKPPQPKIYVVAFIATRCFDQNETHRPLITVKWARVISHDRPQEGTAINCVIGPMRSPAEADELVETLSPCFASLPTTPVPDENEDEVE